MHPPNPNTHSALLDEAVIDAIADYAGADLILSPATRHAAALCLTDALACALGALAAPDCVRLLGPLVPGTTVPNGARALFTGHVLDPMKAAFDNSILIRWLDFNDTTQVGGHPSDMIGALLAVADFAARVGRDLTMLQLLTAMVQAYEIQGCIAKSNLFDRPEIGLDQAIYPKLAIAAVATKLLGGTRAQIRAAISQVWLDGHPLCAYRHVPNAGTRKGWASADAGARAIWFAWLTLRGETGAPKPLSAPVWGFDAVHLKGGSVRLAALLGTQVLDQAIFKLFPCQRNASTAVEAALRLHTWFDARADRIGKIEITTHAEAIIRIDKTGPLPNAAARDHCLQYIVAVALLRGSLVASDYDDVSAADPRIDALRAITHVTESPAYTRDYLDPSVASCANAIRITTTDGEISCLAEVHFPGGDPSRRADAMPLLAAKFHTLAKQAWDISQRQTFLALMADHDRLCALPVGDFITLVNAAAPPPPDAARSHR